MVAGQRLSLMQALSRYLAGLKDNEQRDGQQELNRFVHWCGSDRGTNQLTPYEVAEYGGSASMWGTDSARQMKPVKSFLTYLKQQGLVDASLAAHLKVPRMKRETKRVYFKSSAEQAELSPEGFKKLEARLLILKEERLNVVGDIQRAMADKDFRENAPLDAAKERQGLIEFGIKELEIILANAVLTTAEAGSRNKRVRLGKKVTLRDVSSGKQVRYTLVDSSEADPVAGKISTASPVGKALIDKTRGEEVHITVPKGTLHYVLDKIED